MKIKFDSNQAYQLDAINAVVDVFDGQPLAAGTFEVRLDTVLNAGSLFSELGVGNRLVLNDGAVLANVQTVQTRNEAGSCPVHRAGNFTPGGLFERLKFIKPAEPPRQTFIYNNIMYVVEPSLTV